MELGSPCPEVIKIFRLCAADLMCRNPSVHTGGMPLRQKAVIVLAGASEGYRWRRGQIAKDQVMLAMRIAGGKLNRVQMQIAGTRE